MKICMRGKKWGKRNCNGIRSSACAISVAKAAPSRFIYKSAASFQNGFFRSADGNSSGNFSANNRFYTSAYVKNVWVFFVLFRRQTNLDYLANWREVKLFPSSAIGYLIEDFYIDSLLFYVFFEYK